MNLGTWSFDPLANYSDQSYEQIGRSNVPPYEEQQGNNFHSAGATYKSGAIFQSPLHQTNNEVVDVAAQDLVVIGLHMELANFYREKRRSVAFVTGHLFTFLIVLSIVCLATMQILICENQTIWRLEILFRTIVAALLESKWNGRFV